MRGQVSGLSTCIWIACRRVGWVGVVAAACLLLCCSQAGDGTQQEDRTKTLALLQRAQDEVGRRPDYLPRAFDQIQRGLQQSRNDPLEYGQWLQTLWFYFLLNDDHVHARDALEESLQRLNEAHAPPDLIADITSSLSYSLILLGEVAKAKEYLRQAIVLASPHRNRELLADLYYNIGDAYRKTGERMVSRRYFEAAHEIYDALGVQSKVSTAELKLGSLARDAGNYEEAILRHDRAFAQFSSEGNYRELVTEIELARDYAAQGKLEVADQYAQHALEDPRALAEQRIDASILLLRVINDRRAASARTATSEPSAEALVESIELLIGGSSTGEKPELARPTHQLQFAEQAIRYYALNRDIGKVVLHGRAAIRLARRVASDLRATNDDSLAWLTEAQPVLNAYVKALYELDRQQVFALLEAYYGQRADSGVLRHSGVIGRAFETQAVGLFERYRSAERTLVDATVEIEKLQSHTSPGRIRAAQIRLNQRLRERDMARDAYLAIYHAQPMARLPQELDSVASNARPALPASDVFIRYFVQEEVSFGVALAADDLEYFDLPPRSEVLKLVHSALDALQTPGSSDVERKALTAAARLLPREFLSRHRGTTRLIIVPDDAVQLLPFAAINLGGHSQSYVPLVQSFEIVRTRSASRYYAQQTDGSRDGETPATADIIVFADPVVGAAPVEGVQLREAPRWGDKLFSLPSARKEAASIERTFSTRVVETYLGRAATNDVLLSPAARAASVLHIATHGYYSKTTPDIVGLATSGMTAETDSGGGFLGLTELLMEPFSSRLVVISGCETMRGRDYSGWGVRSLADGFLTQGAGSVVGTLWSVSDAATATLMDRFYRALHGSNGNSSMALSVAQRELAAPGSLFSDPYYWAGVVLESSNRGVDQRAL